ncbi:MAG: helicase-related protein [archaeon GB-1867-005]|nr:helicase-related protein [Candidatus Culexmicrobium cathedralense]
MSNVQVPSIDDLMIGAYQELFLKELENVRATHQVLVHHSVPEVLQILHSYISQFKEKPIHLNANQLLMELAKRKLILIYPDGRVRTRNLELIIRAIYSRAYPSALSTLEYVILKPRESPLPSFEEREGNELRNIVYMYFRTFLDEQLATNLSEAFTNAFVKSIANKSSLEEGSLSEYQYINLKTLLNYASNKAPSISLLAAPTGTGKTWIFVLYAIARILEAKSKGEFSGVKVIILYPRKALARDQSERILKLLHFLNEELKLRGLQTYAISLGIWDRDSLQNWRKIAEIRMKAKGRNVEFRGIKCPICSAKLIYDEQREVIACPSCGLTFNFIGDIREWINKKQPDILITNFWALNYRLISRHYKQLLGNRVRCIIIDEAHVLKDLEGAFTAYLLCRLLLRLAMQYKGVSTIPSAPLKLDPNAEYNALDWIRDYIRDKSLTIILSSATISTAQTVSERNKDAIKFTSNLVYPKLFELFESLCKGMGLEPVIYHDYNDIYEKLYSARHPLGKVRRKIDVVIILAPHPSRGLETIAQSTTLCSLFWCKEFNQKFLLFTDNKEAIERLYHFINDIIIGERGEIYDHLFLTDKNPGARRSLLIHKSWKNYGEKLLSNGDMLIRALEDPLYWIIFSYPSYFNKIITKLRDINKALSQMNYKQSDHFNDLLNIAKASCDDIFWNRASRLSIHHADLDRSERQSIEERLKGADLIGVLCTSTLELGIDIDHISTIIQYKPPRTAENFIQRLGRAGRKPTTMYIATGFLLLSNFETLYLNERYSENALFNVRPKPLPLNNHRVRANAIFYTIIDMLAYLDYQTYYSSKARDANRTANRTHNIYRALLTYEKPIISIIASLFGLHSSIVKDEYQTLTDHIWVLYRNLSNITMGPISIKNIIYNTMETVQLTRDNLNKILSSMGENPNLFRDSEEYQRIISKMFKYLRFLNELYNGLHKLDLYCISNPEYLIRKRNDIRKNLNNYLVKLDDLVIFLNNLSKMISDAILFSKIRKVTDDLKQIESGVKELIKFVQTGIDLLFTLNLRRILR